MTPAAVPSRDAILEPPSGPHQGGRWPTILGLFAGIAVFAVALLALREALASYNFHDVRTSLRAVPAAFLLRLCLEELRRQ